MLMLGTFILCEHFLSGERDFSKYRNQVVILSSHREENSGRVIGIVTNLSDFTWESIEFEARFFDHQGTVIVSKTDYGSFSMPAHSDHAFSVDLWMTNDLATYASHKVSVRNARDPKHIR